MANTYFVPFIQIGPIPDLSGAACNSPDLDPDTWYADDPVAARVAKGYCRICPHGPRGDDTCYERALDEERQDRFTAFGIRGGRSAAQRQRVLDGDKARRGLRFDDGELSTDCMEEVEIIEGTETDW